MDGIKLQYQAQQYWFDASDREHYFIAKAVAHASAMERPQSAEEIRAQLRAGKIVHTGHDWDACIRSLTAIEAQRAGTLTQPQIPMVQCDCGHAIPAASVMHASLGSACPNCYDRLSD